RSRGRLLVAGRRGGGAGGQADAHRDDARDAASWGGGGQGRGVRVVLEDARPMPRLPTGRPLRFVPIPGTVTIPSGLSWMITSATTKPLRSIAMPSNSLRTTPRSISI